MSDFDLIIYDCDGTLTDSENINNRALSEVLQEAGFDYSLEYGLANWVGTTVSSILLQIQMETGRTPPVSIVPDYMHRVAKLQLSGLVPIEGAPSLVSKSKAQYKICVASNGERRNVIESLKITGLMDGNFTEDTVFTKIQVKNPKPYPDLFLFAADQMGVAPNRCLVIEDSVAGVMAGEAAGMTVWGYTGSSHHPEKHSAALKAAGADAVFARLIHMEEQLGL